jgi:translation initiation factor IF-1
VPSASTGDGHRRGDDPADRPLFPTPDPVDPGSAPLFGDTASDAPAGRGGHREVASSRSETPRRRVLPDGMSQGPGSAAVGSSRAATPTSPGSPLPGPPPGPPPPGPPPGPRPPDQAAPGPRSGSTAGAGAATTRIGTWVLHGLLFRRVVSGLVNVGVREDVETVPRTRSGPLRVFTVLWAVLAVTNALRHPSPASFVVACVAGALAVLIMLLYGSRRPGTRVGRAPGTVPDPVPVRHFRVRTSDGREVRCMMPGAIDTGSVRAGDAVTVSGRCGRRGVLIVHQVDVLSGAGGLVMTRLRPRAPLRARMASWSRNLGTVSTVVLLLLVGWQLWLLHS